MHLPAYIARKYFFSGKVSNLIHLISGVSMTGIMVGAFALIVILSVFNGLENLVLSLYNRFDSDIKITPVTGKYFERDAVNYDSLASLEEVLGITGVIEEQVMVRFNENQTVATIKAIEPNYLGTTGMDTLIFRGHSRLTYRNNPLAIVGAGIARSLELSVYDEFSRMRLYLPRPGQVSTLRPDRDFNQERIAAGGVFAVQQEFDDEYIIVPLEFAHKLTGRNENMFTSIELNLLPGADISKVRSQLQEITGADFDVQDRFQQHAVLYKILRSERFAVYLILTFILLIASFNMVGALLMLALEKKKDMAVLSCMGAYNSSLQKIFYWEGVFLSTTGGMIGLLLGSIVCWIQMEFGIVKLGGSGTFIIDAYPVILQLSDFLLIVLTVLSIGLLASVFPAWAISKKITAKDLHK